MGVPVGPPPYTEPRNGRAGGTAAIHHHAVAEPAIQAPRCRAARIVPVRRQPGQGPAPVQRVQTRPRANRPRTWLSHSDSPRSPGGRGSQVCPVRPVRSVLAPHSRKPDAPWAISPRAVRSS